MSASASPHLTRRSATRKVVLSTARAERKLAGRKDSVTRRYRLRTAVKAVKAMAASLPAYLAEQRRLRSRTKTQVVMDRLRAPLPPSPSLATRARRVKEKVMHFFRRKAS